MLAPLTASLRAGGDLTGDEIAAACEALLDSGESLETRAAFLLALHEKGETPAEVAAFVQILLARAIRPALGPGLIDVCGTGGDKAGLFNVSTAVMFVAAACGVPVVKHGNRGITSKCGGADVLEALGVRIDAPPAPALAAAGCCFLFAPLYHPAFKAIAPVRQALAAQGRASVFNLLGPLLNPASPDFQLAGVFHPGLPAIYAEVYRLLGRKNAWVVHGAGGLDEVAVHGPTRVLAVGPDGTTEFSIKPQELGITATGLKELRGGTAQENAALIENLLSGRDRSARREIVALNAACALVVAGRSPDLPAALALARQALDEGSAQDTLERLRRAA